MTRRPVCSSSARATASVVVPMLMNSDELSGICAVQARAMAALPFGLPHWAMSFPLAALTALSLRLAPSGRSRWVVSLAPRLDLEVLRNRWLRQRGDGLGALGAGMEAGQWPRPAVGHAEDDAVESTPPRS